MFTFLYVALMGAAPADSPPVFQATIASAVKPIAGSLETMGAEWSMQIGENQTRAGDLIELIQLGVARPNFPWDRPHLLLVNGDRWPGRIVGIKNDQIRFVPSFGTLPELTIPVASVAVAWLKSPRLGVHPDPSNFDLVKIHRNRDEVYLDNQDQILGTVSSMVGAELRIEQDGKPRFVATDRIGTIAFNTDLVQSRKDHRPTAHVVLKSGARLTLKDAQLQDGRLVGTTLGGPTIRILLGDVVAVSMRSDRVVWLDDLSALQYDHKPFLGTKWLATSGKNASNGPLRLGPHVFDFGVGLHSESRITYPIPPGMGRFEAWVGLDAEAGKQGNVRITATIDGKPALEPLVIDGAKVPHRVNLTIPTDSKLLALMVEFADGGDVQDNVNWADARFIRSEAAASSKP